MYTIEPALKDESIIGKTLDLGRRIELMSMDRHCGDISMGLYRRDVGGVAGVLVHTYKSVAQAKQRVEFITRALIEIVGLERVADAPGWLRFPCRSFHERGLKRAFLEVCKLDTGTAFATKPLSVFDKKAGCRLTAIHTGGGVYHVQSEQQTESAQKRAAALASGFIKICEMNAVEGKPDHAAFACGTSHDALIGMLMFRAQNVRASMREEESTASRGILSAPSQQEN